MNGIPFDGHNCKNVIDLLLKLLKHFYFVAINIYNSINKQDKENFKNHKCPRLILQYPINSPLSDRV